MGSDASFTLVMPPKTESASSRACSHGGVLSVYERGLSFVDQMGVLRGYLSSLGALGVGLGFAGMLFTASQTISLGGWVFPILACVMLFVLFVNLIFVQEDWTGYRYEPVLFDAPARRVHIFKSLGMPWWQLGWNLFGRPRSEVQSFDWACVDAEVVTFTIFTGQVPRRESALVLSIKESPGGSVEIQRVGVGPSFAYGDVTSPVQRWEYVRRFMQGEGPAWAPGEVRYKDFGVTFWESLTLMQPLIGPGSSKYWAKGPLMWIGGAVCLIAFPLSAYIGLNRYLSFRLKRAPKWPDDIRASIGAGPFDDARLKEMVDAVVAKSTQKRLGRQKG